MATTELPRKNRIIGRVFARDTRSGIPDLLAVLYDVDPPTERSDGGDDVTAWLSGTTLGFWADFPGDRLGSVLTDGAGRFTLEYGDDEFQIRNTEKRPDLMLLLLAPDESIGSSATGQHPVQRLVHWAWMPRVASGRTESYNIAIKTEMMERFGLRPSGLGPQDKASFLSVINQRRDVQKALRDATKEHLTTHLADAMTRSVTRREDSWRWFSNPQVFLPGMHFVLPNADPAPVIEQARERSYEQIRNYRKGRVPTLQLDDDDLAAIGLADPETGGTVKICDVLARKGIGTELVRIRNLLDAARQRRRAEGELPLPTTTPPPGEPPPESGGATTDEQLRQIIRERLVGQVQELPTRSAAEEPQALTDLAKVRDAIRSLEISGGPADVAAFHDFYTLQIAFRNVWTAAFDERLRDQASELYDAVVQLHEEYGVTMPDPSAVNDVNAFRQFLAGIKDSASYAEVFPVPPDVLRAYPAMTMALWNRLDEDGRQVLSNAALNHLLPWSAGDDINVPPPEWATQEYLDERWAVAMRNHLTSPLARAERLALELGDRLVEPYAFHYFAPYTINFGIVTCYRQEWMPDVYQAGRLVTTIPLAPGEKRTVKVKETRKLSRIEKEIEKALAEQSSETQFVTRAESEIMARTQTTTNFQMSATGTLNFAIGSVTATSQFSNNQVQESSKNLKRFEEATRKTAEKIRQERELHAEVTDTFESETEGTHEISNTNDEIMVTYLMYELERRYRVTARLSRVTPVIMIALDMPAPHEITDAWILEHAWIIRRVLLDDSFNAAIDMIENGQASDEMLVEIRRATWEKQRELVGKLESMLDEQAGVRDELRERLISTTERQGRAEATELSRDEKTAADILDPLGLFHDKDAPLTADILEVEQKAVETRLGHAEAALEDAQRQLSRAQTALNEATSAYSIALRDQARKQTRINQLRLHIRQNIFHFMHAIWSTKHPDELLFDLYHREVDIVTSATTTCRIRPAEPHEIEAGIPGVHRDGTFYAVECDPPTAPTPSDTARPTLIEIADLDSPMGFKGNYILFPLKQCTHITDFMMQEYIDDYFGVRDPARSLPVTSEELLRYAAELWHDPANPLTPEERSALRALVLEQLGNATLGEQTIVVPTGQVYMEAIKGERVILEDFKRAHRGMDVLKVQEEVRTARLENLRRAARLADAEPMLDPPHADKMIMINGSTNGVLIDSEE